MADGASVAYGSLPFKEQLAFFRRKLNLPTESWTDIWEAMHDHAFVVAGANRMGIVEDFRDAVDRAIANGETLEQFRRRFDAIVAKHGWDYNGGRNWRSRVIYETNLRQSYNAGRWSQLQALKRVRPFWRYRHADGERYPRPLHVSWDNLVLLADDPWWMTHFPANGWGCKCYVEALNQRDLDRLGLKVGTAPPLDMQVVTVGTRGPAPRVVKTPAGVDPGFGYAPGRDAWFRQQAQGVLNTAAELPAAASADAAAQMLAVDRIASALDSAYAEFQDEVLSAGVARNLSMEIGAIDPAVIRKMVQGGIEPSTAPIIARDAELLHALREAKRSRAGLPAALTPAELSRLPALLAQPRAVLLDRSDNVLLYVVDASDRRETGKVVVAINYTLKLADGKRKVNAFRTASLIDLKDVRKEVASGRLVLLDGSLQ